MTPSDVEHAGTVLRSREELIRARQRRQTYTFVTVFALVLLVGVVALGNWQQWWTIGGAAQAASICPTQTVTEPRFSNVNVINGTTRKGLAGAVAKELQKRQFRVLTIETEEADSPIKTAIQVRYGETGKLAARTVALQFPGSAKMINDKRDDETVDVLIGTAYKNMVSAKAAAAAIKPKEDPHGCVEATIPATPEPTPKPSAS
ncbi:MAG TPA: LytR C-terminal domain-containing protein [Kineosporiaceae bacterium]|nr:LytR C-terminal domain-containing protein [Kineosporiaceae bacterium]